MAPYYWSLYYIKEKKVLVLILRYHFIAINFYKINDKNIAVCKLIYNTY
jgi:hypothetical protein